MTIPQRTDVLVVGGGPAGSSTAAYLAQLGYDVVVIDKVRHPRETVGESILPSAWKFFDMLGVTDAVEHHDFVKKAGGVVVWHDEITQIQFRDFAYKKPGLHVERDALDKILLDNASRSGARIYEGVLAESFVPDPDGGADVVVVEGGARSRIRCRFMVDATGQSSLVARQLNCRRLDDDFRFVSLWGYFRDSRYVSAGGIVRDFDQIPHHPPMTFVTNLGGWGWSWHIPLKETTSVGITVPVDSYKREAERFASLDDYLVDKCRSTKYLGDCLAGARLVNGPVRVLRDFSYVSDTLAGPGFFVVGDAAGFVDPIFSVGFVIALYSGKIAAWAIDRALRNAAHEASARRLFEHQMRGRYELARTMALPGIDSDAPGGARTYFEFFSRSEQELMWSAASMTTRSSNLVRTAGTERQPAVLRRRTLDTLQFA